MFGYKVPLAEGPPGEVEREVLAGSGLELDGFKGKLALKARGERRALRVPLGDAQIAPAETDSEPALRLSFSLPAGSFATAVIREVTKG